jgi:hypothetical protein
MKACSKKYQTLMELFLFGRLDASDCERFEDHLFECPVCRNAFRDECLLKTFVMKHRKELLSKPLETTLWKTLRRLLDAVVSNLEMPPIPVQFRNGISTGEVVLPAVYTVNLTGITGSCSENPATSIDGDRLIIDGFSRDCLDTEIYLLICSRHDLFELSPEHAGHIISTVDYIAGRLLAQRQVDSMLSSIISRSFVIRGSFTQQGPARQKKTAALFHLSPIALSYFTNSEYISILIVR